MRYITLVLILIVASHTTPMVELGDTTSPAPSAPVEVLSSVTVLPGVEDGEGTSFVFAAFQPPNRTPVKTGLEATVTIASPDSPVDAPLEVAQVSSSPPSDSNPVATSANSLAATSSSVASSTELWAASVSALNVRAGPSSRNQVVGALTLGEQAVVTGVALKGWVPIRVLASDMEGWVFSRYIAPVGGT